MKNLRAKMRRLRMMPYRKLTLGEKIAKFVIGLLKVAAITAIIVAAVSALLSLAAGIFVAFAIVSAISGGFDNASRAYRSGDQFVRFR